MTIVRRVTSVLSAGLIMGVVVGVAFGVIWWRLAPRVPLVVRPDRAVPQGIQPDGYLGADLAFAALAVTAGIAIAVGLVRMRREHLLSVLVAALLSGAVGTLLMWAVGERLGSVDIEGLAATTTTDIVVDAPLQVTMPALLLVWPMTSAVIITVLAALDWWREFSAPRRAR